MIGQNIFLFNQPYLEGGFDLSIHEEDVWPVGIHVQNLVVVPDIEMLFKWSVVESRQDIYDDSNLLVPRLVAMLAIVSQSVSQPPCCWLHVPLRRVSAASALHCSCKTEFPVKILSTAGVSPLTPPL